MAKLPWYMSCEDGTNIKFHPLYNLWQMIILRLEYFILFPFLDYWESFLSIFSTKQPKMIVIDKVRDIIIVEKSEANKVLKGSKFYCGCCGGVLGESRKHMLLPFTARVFTSLLKNKTFTATVIGLHHTTCRRTMFSFEKEYKFVTLKTYTEAVPQ